MNGKQSGLILFFPEESSASSVIRLNRATAGVMLKGGEILQENTLYPLRSAKSAPQKIRVIGSGNTGPGNRSLAQASKTVPIYYVSHVVKNALVILKAVVRLKFWPAGCSCNYDTESCPIFVVHLNILIIRLNMVSLLHIKALLQSPG